MSIIPSQNQELNDNLLDDIPEFLKAIPNWVLLKNRPLSLRNLGPQLFAANGKETYEYKTPFNLFTEIQPRINEFDGFGFIHLQKLVTGKELQSSYLKRFYSETDEIEDEGIPEGAKPVGAAEYLSIQRYVNGGRSFIQQIENAETISGLKSVVFHYVPFLKKFRSAALRANEPPVMGLIRDIGYRWQEILDTTEGSSFFDQGSGAGYFSEFANFFGDLVEGQDQREFVRRITTDYFEFAKVQRSNRPGELLKPLYPDAPFEIPELLRLPSVQHSVDSKGEIWKGKALIFRRGFIVTKRFEDAYGVKNPEYEITFQKSTGQWSTLVCAHEDYHDQKKFVSKVIAKGIAIDPKAVKDGMSYMSIFIDVNGQAIPKEVYYDRFGWEGDFKACIRGNKRITAKSIEEIVITNSPAMQRVSSVMITEGTLQEWYDNVFVAATENYTNGYFVFVLASYLSSIFLALPFVKRETGWILHLRGNTSEGKTIQCLAAISSTMKPQKGESYIAWDATNVGIERRAAKFKHLPLTLDDAQNSGGNGQKEKERRRNIVYMLTNGIGRSRGDTSEDGTAETTSWSLNALSSAEFSLKENLGTSGTDVRVLELSAPNRYFTSKEAVDKVEHGAKRYYGSFFPAFVQTILSDADSWNDDAYNVVHYEDVIKNNISFFSEGRDAGIASRVIQALAIIGVTLNTIINTLTNNGLLSESEDKEKIDFMTNSFYRICERLIDDAAPVGQDYSTRMVEWLESVSIANMSKFYDPTRMENREPTNDTGWWGRIDRNMGKIEFGWRKEALQKQLETMSTAAYTFIGLIEAGAKKDVLLQGSDKKNSVTKAVNGQNMRLYVFAFNSETTA